MLDEQNVCGFACHQVSEYPEYQIDPVVYSGLQVMDKYYEHVMKESQVTSAIFADDQNMHPLTDTQQTNYYSRQTTTAGRRVGNAVRGSRNQTTMSGTKTTLPDNICFQPSINATKHFK